MKIRVLASPFQLELIRRMDASPVAMTLADVLPGLQQGTIDGTLDDHDGLHHDAIRRCRQIRASRTDQPYVNSIVVMSKKWLATLPPDLQKIVRDDGAKVTTEIVPFVKEFFAKQAKIWKSKGGVLISLPAAEQDAMIAKVSTIGEDLSKDKPELNKAVKLVFEVGRRATSSVTGRAPAAGHGVAMAAPAPEHA